MSGFGGAWRACLLLAYDAKISPSLLVMHAKMIESSELKPDMISVAVILSLKAMAAEILLDTISLIICVLLSRSFLNDMYFSTQKKHDKAISIPTHTTPNVMLIFLRMERSLINFTMMFSLGRC
jgi:hypothetical protein